MKKLVLLLFVLPLVFISCSDDIEDSLNGTKWVAQDSDKYGEETITLKFKKSTFTLDYVWIDYEDKDENENESYSGTYTYDYPTIILDYGDDKQELTVINKKQITMSDGGETLIFKKK